MPLIYDKFGTMIPKRDPRNLPPGTSQLARNVEMSGGKLAPMNFTGGFQTSHDQDTDMLKPQIPDGELIAIDQPAAPVAVSEKIPYAHPGSWPWILWGYVYLEYFDENGVYTIDDVGFNSFNYLDTEYTSDGFLVRFSLGDADRTLKEGLYYKVHGPKFGFSLVAENNYAGGPNANVSYPNPLTLSHTSPTVPLMNMPLWAPKDYSGWDGDPTTAYLGEKFLYGHATLIDVAGPVSIGEWDGTQATGNQLVKLTEAGVVTFYFRCTYTDQTQKYVQYVTQAVDTSYAVLDAPGREGPPSDESEVIVVEPGHIVKLTCPIPGVYTQQIIYRTSPDGTYRELADDVTDDFYYDTFSTTLGKELPPYGNFPHADAATARQRSMFLGGRMGLLIYGDELWPSDPYKLWVYPKEYVFSLFAPIICGMGFLSSAIIWTDTDDDGNVGRVYRVGGQHPAHWTRQLLSECKPLLNEKSVCAIDQTAFYVSNDGLIAVSAGGQVQNITENFYNREDWQELMPEFYASYIRDSSIFLVHEGPNPTHLRIDLNDGAAMLSTFTSLNGGEIEWKGPIETSYRPIAWRCARVHAERYPVTLQLIGNDGEQDEQFLIPSDEAILLPRMRPCNEWEVYVKSPYKINRIAIGMNTQEING